MSHPLGIPKAAMDALIQLVDHNAEIKPGMEVLIGAHIDGAYGSANHVDPVAVSWVQAVCASRGANCTVIWLDEIMKKHEWRVPPILKGAITNADVFFNFSLDLAIEENAEFRTYLEECKTWYVRMFPVTTGLMMTDWARTPHELVVMARHLSSNPFMNHMAEFEMSAPNGSQLTGNILDPGEARGYPRYALQLLAQGCEPLHPVARVGAPAGQLQERERRSLLRSHAPLLGSLHGPAPGLGDPDQDRGQRQQDG